MQYSGEVGIQISLAAPDAGAFRSQGVALFGLGFGGLGLGFRVVDGNSRLNDESEEGIRHSNSCNTATINNKALGAATSEQLCKTTIHRKKQFKPAKPQQPQQRS